MNMAILSIASVKWCYRFLHFYSCLYVTNYNILLLRYNFMIPPTGVYESRILSLHLFLIHLPHVSYQLYHVPLFWVHPFSCILYGLRSFKGVSSRVNIVLFLKLKIASLNCFCAVCYGCVQVNIGVKAANLVMEMVRLQICLSGGETENLFGATL